MRDFFRRYLAWAEFGTFADDFSHYWNIYGRFRSIWRSPVAHFSLIVVAIAVLTGRLSSWSPSAIASLPALLGFSLGAMAIVLAFPTTKMFSILAEGGRDDSYYIDLASKFIHFILFQSIGLIYALIIPADKCILTDMIGFWLLVYAISMGLVVAVSLFGTARLYNHPGAQD